MRGTDPSVKAYAGFMSTTSNALGSHLRARREPVAAKQAGIPVSVYGVRLEPGAGDGGNHEAFPSRLPRADRHCSHHRVMSVTERRITKR